MHAQQKRHFGTWLYETARHTSAVHAPQDCCKRVKEKRPVHPQTTERDKLLDMLANSVHRERKKRYSSLLS